MEGAQDCGRGQADIRRVLCRSTKAYGRMNPFSQENGGRWPEEYRAGQLETAKVFAGLGNPMSPVLGHTLTLRSVSELHERQPTRR
jgi:hypothetical protein